ncbi:MAG: flippase-like domain-containing protein [Acidobacteriia bacterium]|nr:flippase-like domain-containing protein [Terriglobia bacterium]
MRRYFFLLIVLGLSVYFLLPRFAQIQHALEVASTLKIPLLALALGAQILSYLGSGYLLRAVVRLAAKPFSIVEGALLTAGANSVGTLGGGVLGTAGMTYLWLRQRGVDAGPAGLGGWIPIFLNDATLSIISLLGLLTLMVLNKFSSILAAALVLAVLTLGGGMAALLWSLTHREKLMPLATAISNFVARLRRKARDPRATEVAVERLLEAWDALVLQGGWRGPAAGAALNTGFDMLTLAFLFLSAGHGVNLLVLVAGYGVPQLLGKLTVILGGIGVVETTMVGLYGILGVPTAISVVVVLVYRLFSFWLPTLAGIALVPYLENRK